MNTHAYLWLALLATACGRDATPKGPSLQVLVDDGAARIVTLDHTISLATVIDTPIAAWLEVRADTADDRTIELSPATTGEIRLFLDQGRPAIGVFRPVTPDMPPAVAAIARQPAASLSDITSVHVLTKRPVLPAIIVEIEGTSHTIAGETLRAVRGTTDGHAQGWPITDVIKLASDRPLTSVGVVGAETFQVDHLDPARLYLLKLNQRGEYVFRVWDKGARAPVHEVRRVAKIVIP